MTERDLHAEHERIVRDVEWMHLTARRLPQLSRDERQAAVRETLERLTRIGVHMAAEERLFYPVLARLLGTPRVGDAMTTDHAYVHARMQYLAETDPASTAALQAILFGLHAVISTHVRKEEEILMPLLEQLRARDAAVQCGSGAERDRSRRRRTLQSSSRTTKSGGI
jgi:iron-sulfur cluster repair protein YtfE (RIC family)